MPLADAVDEEETSSVSLGGGNSRLGLYSAGTATQAAGKGLIVLNVSIGLYNHCSMLGTAVCFPVTVSLHMQWPALHIAF